MFGFFNVSKPLGPTSHDIVAGVRRMLPRGTRLGHAGTLDPFAEGVLVLCAGPATRLAEHVQAQPKRYLARITLGATSTTDDVEGEITEGPSRQEPERRAVAEVLRRFVGEIRQVPPAHSAVHVNGRRAYELARKGEAVNLKPRRVAVHSIDVVRCDWPLVEIDVRCGAGTYIRALARDVGAALGVGGYCSGLTRTEVGPFRLDAAVKPDELEPARHLLGPLAALGTLQRIRLHERDERLLRLGRSVSLWPARASAEARAAVVNRQGDLIAIARVDPDGRTLRPSKVFPPPA